jgi:hypothetical protein
MSWSAAFRFCPRTADKKAREASATGGGRVHVPARSGAVTVTSPRTGSIQALDRRDLVRWAAERDCLLVLPNDAYVPAVEQRLARLDATVAASLGDTVDADLARLPDRQGIGGPPALESGPGARANGRSPG